MCLTIHERRVTGDELALPENHRIYYFLLTIDYLATHCFGFPAKGRRLALFFCAPQDDLLP